MAEPTNRTYSDMAIPPGEILAEELEARSMTQRQLAEEMGRPAQVINEIIKGKKAITPATALQLEDALGPSAEFWMGLRRRMGSLLPAVHARRALA